MLALTAATPLLTTEISDGVSPWNVYSIRRDKRGRPIVSGASVKGMLRSLYEVVTHSNLGIFSHDKPLKSGRVDQADVAFQRAPSILLANDNLAPSTSMEKLSPADRVFGWAPPGTGGDELAYRGQLRVGGVRCQRDVPGPTGHIWQMATLGEPKPQQIRFYTRDSKGEPLHGQAKQDGYGAGDRLSGYKVYPHQQLPDSYWAFPADGFVAKTEGQHPKNVEGRRYLKFLAAPEAKSDVSFAISDWVPIGTTFATTLYVEGISAAELGALLWVLELPEGGHHKLGKGKPLGLGSIRLTVDWDKSYITPHTKARYTQLSPEPRLGKHEAASLREAFGDELKQHEGATYRSFMAAVTGNDVDHHYPWKGRPGPVEPQAKSYTWFVANEGGKRWALPLLETGELLPNDPS